MIEPESRARTETDLRRPRMRLAEDRFQTLMDAATEEFLAQGYRHGSIENIARATGIGKATIYRHFADKAGLFRAVVSRTVEALSVPPLDLSNDAREPEFVLFEVGLRAFELFLRPRSIALHRMVIEAAPNFPELARLVRDHLTEWNLASLSRYLSGLAETGVPDVDQADWASRQFLNLATHGNRFLIASSMPDEGERRRIVSEAVRLFLNGALVSPS